MLLQGRLPLHPPLSTSALVCPHINNESLLSIRQLCDEERIVIFDRHSLSILKRPDNSTIWETKSNGWILGYTFQQQKVFIV